MLVSSCRKIKIILPFLFLYQILIQIVSLFFFLLPFYCSLQLNNLSNGYTLHSEKQSLGNQILRFCLFVSHGEAMAKPLDLLWPWLEKEKIYRCMFYSTLNYNLGTALCF